MLDRSHAAISPRSEALLYAADRAQHVHDVLRPALDAGEVVITDRFVDSSLAYQGAGRTIPLDDVRMLSRWATEGLQPDLTDPAGPAAGGGPGPGPGPRRSPTGWSRSPWTSTSGCGRPSARSPRADPDRYLVLDATQAPDELAAAIRVRVADLLSGLPLQKLPQQAEPGPPSRRRRCSATRTPRPARPPSCTHERRGGRGGLGAGHRPARGGARSCARRSPTRPR